MLKISLEQWRMFIAVFDYGGFAQAGDSLYKTQSTISHGIKKLESTLGEPLFNVIGRKAVLTEFGATLLTPARELVSRADNLENEAISNKKHFFKSINIAVDTLYPKQHLFDALATFSKKNPQINIQLYETVLSRCAELLEDGTVDIGITGNLPKGFTAKVNCLVDLEVLVHDSHPLASNKNITFDELSKYRQIVIRDSGLRQNVNSGWLGASHRTTVASLSEAVSALNSNLGFAWLPTWLQSSECSQGNLTKLNLQQGQKRTVSLMIGIRPDCAELTIYKELTELLLIHDI